MKRAICRILAVLMIWTPFQIAHAGMIGTDVAQAVEQSATLALSRGDIVRQLQSFGVDQATALERVNAMTDSEIASLNDKITQLPAGALSDAGAVLILLLIAAGIWWWWSTQRR